MTSSDVLAVVDLLESNGIQVWLDGGWGVDALLERQTRPHENLDIAVQHKDVSRLRQLLQARGYREIPKPDTKDWNFVLGDDRGHEVDVHSYAFDSTGKYVYGIEYPANSLTGAGSVNGRAVKCISAEYAVRFRAGYELRETDIQDVRALHERFGIPLPKEHEEWLKRKLALFHAQMPGLLTTIAALRPKRRRTLLIAIDGYGGSGKSTLAGALAASLPGTRIIRTDDFARPNVPGWDWQRMKTQVLDPINKDQPRRCQRYDWPTDRLAEWHEVPVGGIVLIEGVSSMRKELGQYWDLAIWVTCSREHRLARGIGRDGEAKRSQWENVWMPEEDAYVAAEKPEQRADVVMNGEEPLEL